jgi:2-amino-4-hydroxy-6-hydroxymethyldihydropteridine diphosphokinase
MSASVYLGLGANLGDTVATLQWALGQIARLPMTQLQRQSSFYRTAPVAAQGPDFVNAVAAISTDLTPLGLLEALQNIEHLAGRERPFRNAPRTLDIDILLFEEHRANSLELTLPHPRMLQRAFVLVPLHEIAPHLVTPAQIAAVADQHVSRI